MDTWLAKEAAATNIVFMKDWQTEVIEHLNHY
jgi:hypothetical protein